MSYETPDCKHRTYTSCKLTNPIKRYSARFSCQTHAKTLVPTHLVQRPSIWATVVASRGISHRPNGMGLALKKLCVDFKRTNLIFDHSFLLIPYDSQIKLRLKIEPKIWSRSEHISKPKSHLRRDTALLVDDIVDAWSSNVQSQCQLISVQVKRHHKLFSKNLARMNWFQSSHVSSLSDNL
jgi:hypothetical protein